MRNGEWVYANSFIAAAEALANHPEAQNDYMMQSSICANYGIFLSQMNDDEIDELYNLANSMSKNG